MLLLLLVSIYNGNYSVLLAAGCTIVVDIGIEFLKIQIAFHDRR